MSQGSGHFLATGGMVDLGIKTPLMGGVQNIPPPKIVGLKKNISPLFIQKICDLLCVKWQKHVRFLDLRGQVRNLSPPPPGGGGGVGVGGWGSFYDRIH